MIKRIITMTILLCLFFASGCKMNDQQATDINQSLITEFIQCGVNASETETMKTATTDAVNSVIEQVENYESEIDYESLFDFSGWEEDFDKADNKDSFMESYWRKVAAETVSNYEIYNLILNDEKAKESFLNEIRTQMILQAEAYLKSSKITVDNEMKGFIEDMVDEQINDFRKSIH